MRNPWLMAPLIALWASCDPAQAGDAEASLTQQDAREAVGRVVQLNGTDLFTLHVVEVSTEGSVGDRIEARRDRMREFFASQAACTTISVEDDTVILDFGTLDDECVFRGHTYGGIDAITYEQDLELDRLDVTHEFQGFTNGVVTLEGQLAIRYNEGKDLRRIASDYTVTDFEGAELVSVQGEHTLTRLDPAQTFWDGGVSIDGSREWTVNGKTWTVEMRNLDVLMTDPAPMDGQMRVTNPKGQQMDIRYRKHDDVIFARVTGPEGNVWVFVIHQDGEILDGSGS